MKRTMYGRIRRKSLSALQILIITTTLGSVLYLHIPSEATDLRVSEETGRNVYETKDACFSNTTKTVASQNKCLIHVYATKYGIDVNLAQTIAFAESSFNHKAVNHNINGTNDMGLFQINSIHGVPDECRLDAVCNIEWAMRTMKTVGTTPWNSSKHNWK